jgi:hypothetical protein
MVAGALFAAFGGIYFWLPKWRHGGHLDRGLGGPGGRRSGDRGEHEGCQGGEGGEGESRRPVELHREHLRRRC